MPRRRLSRLSSASAVREMLEYSVPESWYDGVYKDKSAPCPAGRPFSMLQGSDKACLLIHGFSGYPGELVRPARDLFEKGFDVYALRLPGHGTTGEDLSHTTKEDWLGAAENAARDLRGRYRWFCLLGHSMGGTVAALTSLKVVPDKLAMIASPAGVSKQFPIPLWMLDIKCLWAKREPRPWHSDPSFVMYYENAPCDDERLGDEYWKWTYLRQFRDFLRMMKALRKKVPELSADTLAVVGTEDHLIGTADPEYVTSKPKGANRMVVIENGTHFLFYDRDKEAEEKAVSAVLDWFCSEVAIKA